MGTQTARADLHKPFTTMEKLVVAMIARGCNYKEAGKRLHIAQQTAKFHAQNAAGKIPGNLPCITKILFWSRGADLDQLTGKGWVPQTPSMAEAQRTKVAAQLGHEEYPLY